MVKSTVLIFFLIPIIKYSSSIAKNSFSLYASPYPTKYIHAIIYTFVCTYIHTYIHTRRKYVLFVLWLQLKYWIVKLTEWVCDRCILHSLIFNLFMQAETRIVIFLMIYAFKRELPNCTVAWKFFSLKIINEQCLYFQFFH